MPTFSISVLGAEKCPSEHFHALYHYVYVQQQKQILKLMKFCFKEGYIVTTTSHINSIPIPQFYKMSQYQMATHKSSNKSFKNLQLSSK